MRKMLLWFIRKLIPAQWYKCHLCGLVKHDLEINSITIHADGGAYTIVPACVFCLRVLAELWANGPAHKRNESTRTTLAILISHIEHERTLRKELKN